MRNMIGQAVVGDDLYGREYELNRLWEMLEKGEHILMLAPRRVGKTSLMLELCRAPRERWDVFYIDVEGGEGPADCVAAILAALSADSRYRSWFEATPFSNAIQGVLGRLQPVSVSTAVLRVEFKAAMGREWSHAADQLQARLTTPPDAARNLLIIVDELPVLVSRMVRTSEGQRDAELLLSQLRHWRHDPQMRGRIHTLVGGSIGLEGVLRRAGLSGSINDLAPFRLDSWDRLTAATFLETLGHDYNFCLNEEAVARILDLLGDPVPYHVQLFFSALRDVCRNQSSRVLHETVEQCFEDRLAGPSGTAHLDHYATRLELAFDEHEYETARDILGRVCQRKDGVSPAELEHSRRRDERTFSSVLRDLKADGYVRFENDRLQFRSNLVRIWWKKHHGRSLAL